MTEEKNSLLQKKLDHSLSRKKRNNSLSKDEEKEHGELKKQQDSYDKEVLTWKKTRSISRFSDLRKMYNSAGVEIYAFKPNYLLRKGNSDADINYVFYRCTSFIYNFSELFLRKRTLFSCTLNLN